MPHNRKKQAITLIEMILAILLLGAIILGGYSIELAMRSMSVGPRDETRLLDELIPIKEKIGKDFQYNAIGDYDSPSVVNLTGVSGFAGCTGFQMNVSVQTWDARRAYCWRGPNDGATSYQFWYYDNYYGAPGSHEVIGLRISDFHWFPFENNTRLWISISTSNDPSLPVDPFTNPGVTLNTTFYSRAVSGS